MTDALSPYVIEADALTKVYRLGTTEVPALQAVSFHVAAGEFVALMGPSGSGKSTLLHLLGCLDSPTRGIYRLNGRDVSRLSPDERAQVRNQWIGFIFQNFNLLPRLSALENVALPLYYRHDCSTAMVRAADALARVGLAHRSQHRPMELSGGERQRVAIARALITDPALLLADEPTGSLDSASGAGIMRLLAELNAEGRAILLVTHDSQVAACARRTIRLHDGRIVD